MQLVGAEGKTRYERASFVAEQLKIIAKDTKTIIVCLSQIARPPVDKHGHRREVVTLESGKDSGSIENSSGLVIGAWRPNETTIRLCILKNTKGRSGATIDCNFDGETMVITEKSKIEDEDVPAPTELEMSSRTFPYADK
jgi:replicative DNA helicase